MLNMVSVMYCSSRNNELFARMYGMLNCEMNFQLELCKVDLSVSILHEIAPPIEFSQSSICLMRVLTAVVQVRIIIHKFLYPHSLTSDTIGSKDGYPLKAFSAPKVLLSA